MGDRSQRRISTRTPRNTVLVIAEGHTERIYFRGLRQWKSSVKIDAPNSRPTDALNLVKFCIGQMDARDIDVEGGDLAICVFDIEGNAESNLKRALKLASENRINIAMTNPCFELWYYLHFSDITRQVTSKDVQDKLAKYIPDYSKTKDYCQLLESNRPNALLRAEKLSGPRSSDRNDVKIPANPGTSMHITIHRIEELVKRNDAI